MCAYLDRKGHLRQGVDEPLHEREVVLSPHHLINRQANKHGIGGGGVTHVMIKHHDRPAVPRQVQHREEPIMLLPALSSTLTKRTEGWRAGDS